MRQEPFAFHNSILQIEAWTKFDQRLIAGISSRQDGYSAEPYHSLNLGLHVDDCQETVIRNREHLAEKLGTALQTWVCAEQIHGSNLALVTKDDQGKGALHMETAIKGVDGLYTKDPSTFLMAVFADCVPLFFFAKKKKMIGIAHAGWRGTVANIAGKMIRQWIKEENISPEEIAVCIGPSIGKCCYAVNDTVIDQLSASLMKTLNSRIYTEETNGQYRLDLKQVNYELLKEAGVLSENIEISNYCTSCQSDLFFSHRRDNGKTGRMLAFIGIKEE